MVHVVVRTISVVVIVDIIVLSGNGVVPSVFSHSLSGTVVLHDGVEVPHHSRPALQ